MTVLTREQAEKVCPEAFGKGGRPPKCDVCAAPWSDEAHPVLSPYGPFTIHACQACSVKLAKRQTAPALGDALGEALRGSGSFDAIDRRFKR